MCLMMRLARVCFNPRAPEGARPNAMARDRDELWVSIHAPPKGRDW